MKTKVRINVRLTDGSELEYHRIFDGILPLNHQMTVVMYGELSLRLSLVLMDYEREMLNIVYETSGEFDVSDIPFDPTKWDFEKK